MQPPVAADARAHLIGVLEDSRRNFIASMGGVTDSEAAAHPQPGRWSILDCIEHVTVVEGRFLRWLERAERTGAPRADKQKEADLAAKIVNREVKAAAPEAVLPTGRFPGLSQALEQFNLARSRTIDFITQRGDDLYSLTVTHPRFGNMNGAELTMIIAGHARRHAEQIREVRAALGQP